MSTNKLILFCLWYEILRYVFTCKINFIYNKTTIFCLIFVLFYITLRMIL